MCAADRARVDGKLTEGRGLHVYQIDGVYSTQAKAFVMPIWAIHANRRQTPSNR
jgi:hypothetical protein